MPRLLTVTKLAIIAAIAVPPLHGAIDVPEGSLNVYNPGTVVLGDSFRVEWASIGDNRFDIDLFDSADCSGSSTLDLCGKSNGCGDSQGDFNVLLPTSIGEGTYSIRVRVHDTEVSGCTGEFATSLTPPNGADGSYLTVESPGDVVGGIEFTAKWDYDDGSGVTENRFSIELYAPDCEGDAILNVCDHPDVGCKDSAGDYPVTIPNTVASGEYSLKIGVFGASSPHGCSDKFTLKTSSAGADIDPDQTPVDSPWDNIPTKPECDPNIAVEVRYATSSNRVYFEHTDPDVRGGCANLTMIANARVETDGTLKGPLYPLDANGNKLTSISEATNEWLIESDIYVEDGITLQLYGTASGGDCDALRILSTDTEYYNLRGHGGSLDIKDTVITSWDTSTNAPRETDLFSEDDDSEGRSYISCITEYLDEEQTCDGMAQKEKGDCRMDIVRSEIAYLGYYDSEAYGLTWKVRGFCKDKSNPELFDTNNVYGDVIDSDIHHLFYGLYTYGHQGGVWTGNKMHDNEWYGFDPHDDSDYLTIHNNEVYNNGKHGIIASKRCDHVSIQGNTVYNGGETAAGIFLHRSSDFAIVKNNIIYDMQDAGLAALESFDILFENNAITNCKYGARFSLGSARNVVKSNTFSGLTSYGFFTYVGSNEPDVSNIERPYDNQFILNHVSGPVGVKVKEADNTIVTGNTFTTESGSSLLLEFKDADGTVFMDNMYADDAEFDVDGDSCFSSTSDSNAEPKCD